MGLVLVMRAAPEGCLANRTRTTAHSCKMFESIKGFVIEVMCGVVWGEYGVVWFGLVVPIVEERNHQIAKGGWEVR